MMTGLYTSNKKKRQSPKELANLESGALPDLNSATVAETSPAVKPVLGRPRRDPSAPSNAHLGIRTTAARKELYHRAAKNAGVSITDWVIDQLDRAAITQP